MANIKFIKINYINDIKEFISEAAKVNGDVLVKKGSHCVDGTSVLGMFSLDTSQGVSVEYPSDAIEFDQYLNKFVGE